MKLNLVVSLVAVAGLSLSAVAQDAPPRGKDRPQGDRQPGGGQPGERGGGRGMGQGMQLAPEKAKAAQETEATGVAKRLGLNDEQTKTLVKAYAEARASHTAALDKARKDMRDKAGGGGGDPEDRRAQAQEMMKQMETINKTEQEKFDKALGSGIPAESKTKALASLGTFMQMWDRWVDGLSDFKLDAKKNQEALNAIEDHVVALSKIRPGGDREEMQSARQDATQKLTDSMKKILTEEQFTKFEQSIRGRGGRGGGGGRGGNGGGGGGGGGGGDGGGN